MKNLVGGLRSKEYVPVSRIVIIIFLVLMIVLVGNGVTGFTTSLMKIQENAANATKAQTTIETMQRDIGECTATLNTTSHLFNSCRSELENKKTEASRLNEETYFQQANITAYANSVAALREEANELRSLTDSLAINLCCIRSVVNNGDGSGHYYIKGNKTVCIDHADETLGTRPFSC